MDRKDKPRWAVTWADHEMNTVTKLMDSFVTAAVLLGNIRGDPEATELGIQQHD